MATQHESDTWYESEIERLRAQLALKAAELQRLRLREMALVQQLNAYYACQPPIFKALHQE